MARRRTRSAKAAEPEAVKEPDAAKAEYGPDEHELMLQHLDLMHHETREQTIARLRAALKAS